MDNVDGFVRDIFNNINLDSKTIDTVINTAYYSYLVLVVGFIVLNVVIDVNYLLRTAFVLLFGQFDGNFTLRDITSILGFGTFQDCDVELKSVRLARILRELDFARYHYYERTGIAQRSFLLGIKALQGSTFTVTEEPIPLFTFYKIYTRLVYWDERSLFLEHEVMTINDGRVRCLLLSRQHAIDPDGQGNETLVEKLIEGLPGSENKPPCPEYIKQWLYSCKISSENLKKDAED